MFRIKICGVASVKDAQLAALAGADGIGLNFYEPSPRYVTPEVAAKIASVLPARVQKVGVFVNAAAARIAEIAEQCSLDYVQLHGDEPPELLSTLPAGHVIRTIRLGDGGAQELARTVAACQNGRLPDAWLIDAEVPGQFGGTGAVVDWDQLAGSREVLGEVPLILAGGLTPFNVEDAIAAVRPVAVDVASGVESKPGAKDPLLVRAFVNAARKAFQRLDAAQP